MSSRASHVPVTGTWVRQVPAGGAPMWTGRRENPGRFHRAGELAIYLADGPDTAWAEWYRWLAEWARAPLDLLPRDLYRIGLDLDRVLDLSTANARRAAGAPTRTRPSSLQWRAFQNVAAGARAEGAQGILYSSAARTRSLCLCVFEAGLGGLRIEGEPVRVIAPPAPPRGLRT